MCSDQLTLTSFCYRGIRWGQSSLLTMAVSLLPKKIRNVCPRSHFQALGYPFQAHGGLGAHLPRQGDLVWVTFAPGRKFALCPAELLESRCNHGLGSLLICLVPFAPMMMLSYRTWSPGQHTRNKILRS